MADGDNLEPCWISNNQLVVHQIHQPSATITDHHQQSATISNPFTSNAWQLCLVASPPLLVGQLLQGHDYQRLMNALVVPGGTHSHVCLVTSSCHRHITHVWPLSTSATRSLLSCWATSQPPMRNLNHCQNTLLALIFINYSETLTSKNPTIFNNELQIIVVNSCVLQPLRLLMIQ